MLTRLLQRLPGFRTPAKRALVRAGGGVVGGMYEVGALAALDGALLDFHANHFDLYVGSSAGAVVATLMANQVGPLELYAILDEERDDPLNFHRGSVYHRGSFGNAARNFGRLVWAVGKKAITKYQLEWPDILARSGDDMPSGFFSLAPFEAYVREALGHITSIKLLDLGLQELRLRHPEIEVHVIQPDPVPSPLRGSSMGFEASRAALRFGYTSVKDWLGSEPAAPLRRRFGIRAA